MPKIREWKNWATSEELAKMWNVSQRRVQQILVNLKEEDAIDVGVIVIDIGTTNPISKPIYLAVGDK